jgi:hypothetical protein
MMTVGPGCSHWTAWCACQLLCVTAKMHSSWIWSADRNAMPAGTLRARRATHWQWQEPLFPTAGAPPPRHRPCGHPPRSTRARRAFPHAALPACSHLPRRRVQASIHGTNFLPDPGRTTSFGHFGTHRSDTHTHTDLSHCISSLLPCTVDLTLKRVLTRLSCHLAPPCLHRARVVQAALGAVAAGRARILYATPEALAASWAREALRGVRVALAVVDEAHLASPAGGACRPGCVRLPALLAAIAPDAPRCALSAV